MDIVWKILFYLLTFIAYATLPFGALDIFKPGKSLGQSLISLALTPIVFLLIIIGIFGLSVLLAKHFFKDSAGLSISINVGLIFSCIAMYAFFYTHSKRDGKGEGKEDLYSWYPSESAPYLYPATIHVGYFGMPDKRTVYIPSKSVVGNSWGLGQSLHVVGEKYKPLPEAIEIVWLSFTENKFYFVSEWLPKEKLKALFDTAWKNYQGKECRYDGLVVGMAPYGMIQIWAVGDGRTTEVCCLHGPEVSVPMSEFRPNAIIGQDEYVQSTLENRPKVYENLKKNGLPDTLMYENYRKRFNYHIVPQIEMENVNLRNITISYFNGEYDNILWERLEENRYSEQARPRKIYLDWKNGKDEYDMRFLFDEQTILSAFEKAFGSDYPQSDDEDIVALFEKLHGESKLPKGDLSIHIDSEGNPIGISLETDKGALNIPHEKMQVVVFKNDKFLCNYSGIKRVHDCYSHCSRTARIALYLDFPFFLAVSTME